VKYFAFVTLIFLYLFGAPAGGDAETFSQLASPPIRYLRNIQIRVTDRTGRPLSGVDVEIVPEWGQLATDERLRTDASGVVRFQVAPIIEDPLAGRLVRDRFLFYRTVLTYHLRLKGFVTRRGRIEDVQEFAAHADPLFQGLDREPTPEPLVVPVVLPAYHDYLSDTSLGPAGPLLVYALLDEGPAHHITLLQSSLTLDPDGRLLMGLEFDLLFDPADVSLENAAAVLLREPVRACLELMRQKLPPSEKIKTIEIKMSVGFRRRKESHAAPEIKNYRFVFPVADAWRLAAWDGRGSWPLHHFDVAIDQSPLDLSTQLNP